MTLQARIQLANRIVKVLAVCALIALVAIVLSLTPGSAKAQCPGGVCPQPQVVTTTPVYRAPVRRFLYEFLTPQGVVMQGYYVRPLAPYTPAQIRAQQQYWNERAAQLAK